MPRLTGGQAIVKSLRAQGVDVVFGLPGVQLDHLFNALHDESNSIRVIHPRHEQAAAYMAFGYAQATGRVGTYAVVPGPGLLNTTAALSTAYACNSPVLALTGEIISQAIGKGFGLLHEIPDQLGLIRGLTKWAARIEHTSQASSLVAEAFKQLTHGVAKPVELEMPMDLLGVQAACEIGEKVQPAPALEPDPDMVTEAARLLGSAKQPMIVCGGGAVHAGEALLEVAEMLQAPVVSHRMGKGVVSDRHYLSQSLPAGHRLWPHVDVVLAVGTRMQHQCMTWGLDDDIKVVRIDLEPSQMHRFGKPAVGLVADARAALNRLAEELPTYNAKRGSRKDELEGFKAAMVAELETKLAPQAGFIKVLRNVLPDDGVFVEELTQVGYVARSLFPGYEPRRYLSSGYQGTLGAGFPTALGAKVALPDKAVLSITGDGGFMFNVQELSTAAMHGIDLVTVVFNDNAFGNVKRMQEDLYGGRVIGSELRNPDFLKLADSFGVKGVRAKDPAALKTALEQGFAHNGPTLIEVPVGKMPDPWGISQPFGRAR
jgi:acetolactate synthase-1/2/3 large subunit